MDVHMPCTSCDSSVKPLFHLLLRPWVSSNLLVEASWRRGLNNVGSPSLASTEQGPQASMLRVTFIHSFPQPMFTEHQLHARHCVRGREYSNEWDTANPGRHVTYFWRGGAWVLSRGAAPGKGNLLSEGGSVTTSKNHAVVVQKQP